ncbi:MAG: hypothetical protein ACYSU0_14170 [Planctomycetota bacterium]
MVRTRLKAADKSFMGLSMAGMIAGCVFLALTFIAPRDRLGTSGFVVFLSMSVILMAAGVVSYIILKRKNPDEHPLMRAIRDDPDSITAVRVVRVIYNTVPIKTQLVFTLPMCKQAVLDVTKDEPELWVERLREMAPKAKLGTPDQES